MEFRCPQCGALLAAKNNPLHIQCPECNAIFSVTETAPPVPPEQDKVIDVHAEVLSSEYEVPQGEMPAEPVGETYGNLTTDGHTDTRVYWNHNMVFERREGCGCGGCGCLTVLLLLLLLLFGM